ASRSIRVVLAEWQDGETTRALDPPRVVSSAMLRGQIGEADALRVQLRGHAGHQRPPAERLAPLLRCRSVPGPDDDEHQGPCEDDGPQELVHHGAAPTTDTTQCSPADA